MIRVQITQAPRVRAGCGLRLSSPAERCSPQAGFTLVEMLVSVTLVLLMMVMFGEIFQLATNSVTKQRVMADNDQNARTFVTVIRGDLENRSFRTVVPFYANEPVNGNAFPSLSNREGYFSISNNNQGDSTDDVLQFTAKLPGDLKYYGRATALPGNSKNQPERDDNRSVDNEAGASHAAEISYWLRAGKLYRRVMLLRAQPTYNEDLNRNEVLDAGEDINGNGSLDTNLDYFGPPPTSPAAMYPSPRNFWGEFDYSAHPRWSLLAAPLAANQPIFAQFHGRDYLDNSVSPSSGSPRTKSLGQPWNRFGFNYDIATSGAAVANNGRPREFGNGTPNFFIGRFTQSETSDPRFQFPHRTSYVGNGNPMDASMTVLNDMDGDGVVDEFTPGGSRIGVDLLLSHVHEFRVEVWDERLLDFASIGHSRTAAGGIAGDYHISRRLNSTYGPLGGQANVFDTWHPRFNRNVNMDAGGNPILGDEPDQPPYRPLTIDPTGFSGPTYTNRSGASLYWMPNVDYQVGDIVFPLREDLNGNGILDPGEDGSNGFPAGGALQENVSLPITLPLPGLIQEDINNNGMLDGGEDGYANLPRNGALDAQQFHLRQPFYPTGLTFAYRCVIGGRSGIRTAIGGGTPSILDEPFASAGASARSPGTKIPESPWTEDVNNNGVFDAGEDLNGNGMIDREPQWEAIYNARPLKAIRITVRFEHPTSKQMKQVTIVQSLRDATSVP